MTLDFTEHVMPRQLVAAATADGPTLIEIVAYSAEVHDGQLRVIASRHLIDGLPTAAISVCIGKPGNATPFRKPTDDELRAVTQQICPSLGFRETPHHEPNTRGLWQLTG